MQVSPGWSSLNPCSIHFWCYVGAAWLSFFPRSLPVHLRASFDPCTHPESVLSLHFTFWSIHHPSFAPSKIIHSSSKCTPFINQFLLALTPKWGNSMSLCFQRHWEMVIIKSVKSPFATASSEWSVEDNRSPSVSEEGNVGCISSSYAHPNSQSFFWGVYAP